MTHIIKNNTLEVAIDFPLENYKGSRFDWSGKISSVKFKSLPLTTIEDTGSKDVNFLGKGLYNEFGIASPIGFEETPMGGWFHKIGVGLLKKEHKDYLFHRNHLIKPASFDVNYENQKIIIICKSENVNGYSYILKKEITVSENSLIIDYSLHNTGEKRIITDEYVHNFMAINNTLIGKDYELKFPFPLNPSLFDETVNSENKVEIGLYNITFNKTPEKQFFFSNLTGGKELQAEWILTNLKANVGIKEIGSFKTEKINVWGWKHVISPELFFKISVDPKKTIEWSRKFEVFKINP
tara:strand:+ start:7087 stop:7974 length:888 start_codon:yes stop_codon:yes gene_type:complete